MLPGVFAACCAFKDALDSGARLLDHIGMSR